VLVTIESHSPRAVTETRLIFHAAAALLLCTVAGNSQAPAPSPAAAAQAQPVAPSMPKAPPALYRNLVVIDPAHGGTDTGAHLPDGVLEKSVTLAFAQKLRPALAAQGFTVISTRDSDPPDSLPTDQRAGTANHARPLACLMLHATASGSGIHIASSSPSFDDATPRVLRWSEAQTGVSAMSLRLANEIGLALSNAHLPVILLRTSVSPIDSLTCPAIILEIAPLIPSGGTRSPVTNGAYQQHVAEAVATGLASFRTHNAPPPAVAPATPPRPAPEANAPGTSSPAAVAPENKAPEPKPSEAKPSVPVKSPAAGAPPRPSDVKPTAPTPPASPNPGAAPR
jgi:N-acetylmuramoyl-L-alanine amidase